MERYYFNFFDGTQWIEDSVGQEAESISKLHAEAQFALVDMSKKYLPVVTLCTLLYKVINESGDKVFIVSISLKTEFISDIEI